MIENKKKYIITLVSLLVLFAALFFIFILRKSVDSVEGVEKPKCEITEDDAWNVSDTKLSYKFSKQVLEGKILSKFKEINKANIPFTLYKLDVNKIIKNQNSHTGVNLIAIDGTSKCKVNMNTPIKVEVGKSYRFYLSGSISEHGYNYANVFYAEPM